MSGIFIGSDHRGFDKKQKLLSDLGKIDSFSHQVLDLGAYANIPDDDYNDITITVARSVLRNPRSFGVLLCGSGIGVSIQANRIKGIRAVVGTNAELVKMSREHNDANIICLSADTMSSDTILQTVKQFISTDFSNEARHARRNNRLDEEINP